MHNRRIKKSTSTAIYRLYPHLKQYSGQKLSSRIKADSIITEGTALHFNADAKAQPERRG